jgi:hypothetical protein
VRVAERILAEPRPALALVPYFADADRFMPAPDRLRAREEFVPTGLPADGPLLLTVAAYSRRKNVDLSLRVLAELGRARPDARLALVGRPQPSQERYAAELAELAAKLGLAGSVHFLPTMDHGALARLMAASDLLLHLTTCRLENFGLVVAEALASGLPVVGADWGGLRDLVTPGATGYLAPTWLTRNGPRVDWRAAADEALALVADGPRRERLGQRAAEHARAHLTLDAFAGRLTAAVEQALARPRADAPARFTEDGARLAAAAAQVNLRAGPRSQSEDFRMLLALDDGARARFLLAPAATWSEAPRVHDGSRLYPAVAFEPQAGGGVRITDPSWVGPPSLDPADASLVLAADGERPLGEAPAGPVAERLARAQRLVDLGALALRTTPSPVP